MTKMSIKFFQYLIFMLSLMLTRHSYIRNLIFIPMQISVPHNESDKLPRGGLDKMTLIEVCKSACRFIFWFVNSYNSFNLCGGKHLFRLVHGSAWTQLKYLVAVLEVRLYMRIHSMCRQTRYWLPCSQCILIISLVFYRKHSCVFNSFMLVVVDSSFAEEEKVWNVC
jgi:hypothetical protein